MRDGAIHYKLYVLKYTMAVDNFVFRIIRGAFLCSYQSLMYVFLYNTIKWPYPPKHSPSYVITLCECLHPALLPILSSITKKNDVHLITCFKIGKQHDHSNCSENKWKTLCKVKLLCFNYGVLTRRFATSSTFVSTVAVSTPMCRSKRVQITNILRNKNYPSLTHQGVIGTRIDVRHGRSYNGVRDM